MSARNRIVAAILAIVGPGGVVAGQDRVRTGLSATDWSSIRSAYEAGRHTAVSAGDGYEARNPGQAWRTRFDGRGFETTPDGGGWRWGLELVSYGRAGSERAVGRAACVEVVGGRVSYAWDETLTEWYVNDRRGVEHGYTIDVRPEGCAGPLEVRLAVRGELRPRIGGDGRSVEFVDGRGAAAVTYGGLKVIDADGREQRAWFEASGRILHVMVDEAGARYPLTIDPIAQQSYLKASNTGAADQFGWDVAVSGDTVVVAAVSEDSNATGVNGDQNNNSAGGSGAAYVFVRSGSTWSQQAYLKASNTEAGDAFGWSVALSGDTVVVGATREDSMATGVNGDQLDNSAAFSGAAYVFVRNGSTWSQQAYLKASNTGANDWFGRSVAVSGDTVVVGAYREASSTTGVNGDQADNNASSSGAAYVFVRSGSTWSQQAYLKASNTGASDEFGGSVAVSGDKVIVGAIGESSDATGVNGNQSDNTAADSGAAYVFVRSGSTWTQQAYLKASNTEFDDQFGWSVAVSGNTVIVGAVEEDSSATGVNGNQSSNSAYAAGAAYVFVRSGMTWSQQAYLKASNTDSFDEFGRSVAVSGDTVAIGAGGEDSSATGVNGDRFDNSASFSGAAYVFVRSGSTWSQQAYLKASNTEEGDLFGTAVGLSGDTVVVGAQGEDSVASGVNGDPSDNGASTSGAAYVFVVDTDNDGIRDSLDGCPNDAGKTSPGACGCGIADGDSDGDGTANCRDGCPNDSGKTSAGVCGCGVAETDSDGDGTPDCVDGCPGDSSKVAAGECGCGTAEIDTDGDGTPDCLDACPENPNRLEPRGCGGCGGACGMGMAVSGPATLLVLGWKRRRRA